MFMGLLFAIFACFIWGTIFVIPQFLSDFSSMEVALGRYFCYGFFSLILFFSRKKSSLKSYSKETWKAAFLFALFSNILYYPPLVLGIRYASAPVTVLIAGMCPLVIALYGNYRTRERSFRSLIIPSLWIFLGIFLANASEIDFRFSSSSVWEYLLGLAGAICALCSWSIFAVHNSQFLKKHPEMPRSEWSTVIGLATLVCTCFLLLFLGVMGWGIDLHKFADISLGLTIKFALGIAFLGIFCSWVCCFLWNEASSHLPISLVGPLAISETIFGLCFVFMAEGRMPTLIEFFGIVSMIWGIISVIHLFRHQEPAHENLKDHL